MKKGDIPNKRDRQIQLQQMGRTKLVRQCNNKKHLNHRPFVQYAQTVT